MIAENVYTLAALGITTALTNAAQTAVDGLAGMAVANISATLLGGTGGSRVTGIVQTTVDDGVTWLDVARFDFDTGDSPSDIGSRYCVIQTQAAKGVTRYAALASEGVNDGLLGDQLRAMVTTVGTFTDTTLAIRVAVH